jgi:hypothetical protein
MAEIIAQEAVKDGHRDEPAEEGPDGVGDPENRQGLNVAVDARVEVWGGYWSGGDRLDDGASAVGAELLAWRNCVSARAAIHGLPLL